MFEPKKAIPPIAAAMLALTGCGDSSGSGGDAGNGGSGGTGATGTGGTGGTGATGTGGTGGTGATGTGGTGGTGATGTGGSGGSPSPDELQKALDAYCMKLVECNLKNTNPQEGYETVEECKQQDGVMGRYEYALDVGGDCAAALTDYWYCFAENECREVVAGLGFYNAFCEEPRLSQPEEDCPAYFDPQ